MGSLPDTLERLAAFGARVGSLFVGCSIEGLAEARFAGSPAGKNSR